MTLPQTRLTLWQLWDKLPVQNRQRALVALGRMIVEHLEQPSSAGALPAEQGGDLSLTGLPGKGAGDERH